MDSWRKRFAALLERVSSLTTSTVAQFVNNPKTQAPRGPGNRAVPTSQPSSSQRPIEVFGFNHLTAAQSDLCKVSVPTGCGPSCNPHVVVTEASLLCRTVRLDGSHQPSGLARRRWKRTTRRCSLMFHFRQANKLRTILPSLISRTAINFAVLICDRKTNKRIIAEYPERGLGIFVAPEPLSESFTACGGTSPTSKQSTRDDCEGLPSNWMLVSLPGRKA